MRTEYSKTEIRDHAVPLEENQPLERPSVVTLHPKTVALIMGAFSTFLVASSVGIQAIAAATGYETMHGLVRFFNLDEENNLPTWYASASLLFSALLLAIIGCAARPERAWAPHWFGLSGIFVVLSMDEVGSFHEIFIAPARTLLDTDGLLYFAWIIPAAAVTLLIALIYARWFFHLPKRTRRLGGLAALLFVGGALGMELPGGLLVSRGEKESLIYLATATVEETMELFGVLVWVYCLLDFARMQRIACTVRFGARLPLPRP